MNALGAYVLHASLGSEVEGHLVQGPFSSCASHASCHQANVQAAQRPPCIPSANMAHAGDKILANT